jgi:lambda repressor-like predicted transcriptional regulator
MTSTSIRQYKAVISAAIPSDVAHYRRVMAQYAEYPYEGAGTNLTRALWLEKTGWLEVKPMHPIKRYLKDRGWNAKRLAHEAGVKLNTLYKIMSERCGGPVERKVLDYMAANPVTDQVVTPVDIKQWRSAVHKLDGLIQSGRVRNVEIYMEVGS